MYICILQYGAMECLVGSTTIQSNQSVLHILYSQSMVANYNLKS